MKTKHAIMIGAVALAVLLIVAVGFYASQFHSGTSYAARIHNAQNYMEIGNYDKAILEYQAAIDLDGSQEDAYLGLARLYYSQGYTNLSRKTLETGMLSSNSTSQLRTALKAYFPDDALLADSSTQSDADSTAKSDLQSVQPSIDRELAQFISTATYSDYKTRYRNISVSIEVSTDGDRCVMEIPEIQATALFYDTGGRRAVNSHAAEPYDECVPNELRFHTLSYLLGGADSVTWEELRALGGVSQVMHVDTEVSFQLYGSSCTATCDHTGKLNTSEPCLIIPSGAVSQGDIVVSGVIYNAVDRTQVSGAQLTFYKGGSEEAASTVTDYWGQYTVYLTDHGFYTVTVSRPEYIVENFQVYVSGVSNETQQDFTIAPVLNGEEMRIVLEWGSTPRDLDSHLTGRASDGSNVHVYFEQKSAVGRSGDVLALLDVDDTDGYGPETLTLYDTSGSYVYEVVDYTQTTGVGSSNAVVRIYKGGQLLETFRPDPSAGTTWRVCSISQGDITPLG